MHRIFVGEARRDIYTGNVATINIDRREENSRWRVGVGEVYDRKEMEKFGHGEEWHRYWQIKMHRHCVYCATTLEVGASWELYHTYRLPAKHLLYWWMINSNWIWESFMICDSMTDCTREENIFTRHERWTASRLTSERKLDGPFCF